MNDLAFNVSCVDSKVKIIAVLNTGERIIQFTVVFRTLFLNIFLEGREVIFLSFYSDERVHHIVDPVLLINRILFMNGRLLFVSGKSIQKCAEVNGLRLDLKRISGDRVFLYIIDKVVSTLRYRIDQCNSDNTDRSCKRSKDRSAFFRKQILQRKGERCEERHRRLLLLCFFLGLFIHGSNIRGELIRALGGEGIPLSPEQSRL